MRGQNRRPFPPLHHGQLLAQPMPQVLLLPGPAGRNRHVVLHKKRHDPLQKRLHQIIWKQWSLQRLWSVYSSQRAGDEGAGQRVPPQVFHMFHLPEPARPRGSVPLHQRQPVLRTRQTHSAHQRPFEFTADEPTTARPEGVLGGSRAGSRMCAFILALTHCHPRQRGSAAPQPFSCAPRPFAPKESSTHPTSYLTFISATHTQRSAFNLGFSPNMGGYLHLMHLNRDTEDSMTLEFKKKKKKGDR